MINYYVLLTDDGGGGQCFGPFSLVEAEAQTRTIANKLYSIGWRTIEIREEGHLYFICDKGIRSASIGVVPEDHYQMYVWEQGLKTNALNDLINETS